MSDMWQMHRQSVFHYAGRTEIPDAMRQEWQGIVDLIARLAGVRAALVMQVKQGRIGAFVASRTPGSPYRPGKWQRLQDSGLYCERVIRQDGMLFVPDAEKSDEWRHNPDMAYHMKCYLGLPVHLPDGALFGTICILDDKSHVFPPEIVDLMGKMRNLIESYLRLLYQSITDPLTGLYNRGYLDVEAGRLMAGAERMRPAAGFLIDVDRFKQVNDSWGHLEGDRVLAGFAGLLAENLRAADLAFRFGGDEFLVLLPGTDQETAQQVAGRLQRTTAGSRLSRHGPVTVSIGVAEYVPGESFDQWFSRLDRALYHSKKSV